MRGFTLIVSAVFTATGIWLGTSGSPIGWLIAAFFGLCLLVAIFEHRLPKPWLAPEYRVSITKDDVACDHPRRARESIRWEDVSRIWYITTSDGPRFPDEWLLFEGEHGGCSFPTEAAGMDGVWDELEGRFPGFDFGPMIRGGTDDAKHLCWERGK